MLGANPEPIGAENFGDFSDRPGGFKTKIADDDVGFVNEDAGAALQLREADPRIDVAIIIRAADDDLRRIARRAAEKGPDPVGRRGHFFDDLLELLDHVAGVADHLSLGLDFGAQHKEALAREIVGRQECDGAIESLEQGDNFPFVRRVARFPASYGFVAHGP